MHIHSFFMKVFLVSIFFLCVLSGNVFAQWQTSAGYNIELGTRDKFGDQGSYKATFLVVGPQNDPDKKEYKIERVQSGDDFLSVWFPEDFKGAYILDGKYSWEIIINGEREQHGTIEFKVNDTL